MWLSNLPRLIFTATMFCTLIVADGTRAIRYVDALELDISPSGTGWKEVTGPGGFYTVLYIDEDDNYITISELANRDNVLDSCEALLSIWEYETDFSAGRLQRIKSYEFNKSDGHTLDQIFRDFGYNPEGNDDIPTISIERDNQDDDEHWRSLRGTTFGSDATKICTEFKATEGMHIVRFEIGRDGADGRWIRVSLSMNEDDD